MPLSVSVITVFLCVCKFAVVFYALAAFLWVLWSSFDVHKNNLRLEYRPNGGDAVEIGAVIDHRRRNGKGMNNFLFSSFLF